MTKDELIKLAEIAGYEYHAGGPQPGTIYYPSLYHKERPTIHFNTNWKPHEDLNQLREVWNGLSEHQHFEVVADVEGIEEVLSVGYVFNNPEGLCKLILKVANER